MKVMCGIVALPMKFDIYNMDKIEKNTLKQIIADHKGFLAIQSNNDEGTRFVIRLPLDFTKIKE